MKNLATVEMQKVLFVDDEVFFAAPYVEALQKRFVVKVVDKATDAIRELKKHPDEYVFASLDMMMPPPLGWNEKTNEGLDTGLEILKVCRESIIKAQLPIVVLTNRSADYAKEGFESLEFPEGLLSVRSKIETPPSMFLDLVVGLVGKWIGRQGGVGKPERRAEHIQSKVTTSITIAGSLVASHKIAIRKKKKSFLAVATEWDSRHGGLSTFNRELCVALAKAGHKTFCYVPCASDQEIKSASSSGVVLVQAHPIPGMDQSSWLLQRPILPSGQQPDFVIGHDRQTGPHAMVLCKDSFKDSARIHFIHTAPAEIEWFKPVPAGQTATEKAEDRQTQQVDLSRDAKVVAAVGPRLYDAIAQALHGIVDPPERILAFMPGLTQEGVTKPKNIPPAYQCLVLGRAEDKELKGLDLAARAMSIAQDRLKKVKIGTLELVVRGVPEGEGDDLRKWMLEKTLKDGLRIIPKSYTTDAKTLHDDIIKASLVLMPSKAEGFGLVGLEAIALGVPVLLSEESGLAMAIKSLSEEESKNCVAAVNGDLDTDSEEWSRLIEFALRDRRAAFGKAWEMRQKLIPHMNWDHSVRTLCDLLDRL